MPSYETHIRSVAEQLRAYESIDHDCIRSKAIILFYAGMHIIEAVAKTIDNKDFQHHSHRGTYMFENHRRESKHYTNLYDIGYQARYNPHRLAVGTLKDLDNLYRVKIIEKCLLVWAARVLDKPNLKDEISASKVLAESC